MARSVLILAAVALSLVACFASAATYHHELETTASLDHGLHGLSEVRLHLPRSSLWLTSRGPSAPSSQLTTADQQGTLWHAAIRRAAVCPFV